MRVDKPSLPRDSAGRPDSRGLRAANRRRLVGQGPAKARMVGMKTAVWFIRRLYAGLIDADHLQTPEAVLDRRRQDGMYGE